MTTQDPSNRILRRDELDRLRSADTILQQAEDHRRESERSAEELQRNLLSEARKRALRESTQAASRVIAEAEAAAQQRMTDLEPELARLVARTVREIIGSMDPEQATYRAALTALQRLRDHRGGTIYTNSDSVQPVRRALDDLPAGGAEVDRVIVDDRLPKGRVILSSDQGYAELGVDHLTDAALRPWERDE